MSLKIARTAAGNCAGCSLLIDAGEYYEQHAGDLFHAGCEGKYMPRQLVPSAEFHLTSPFLFDDPVRAEDERVKENVGAASLAFQGKTYSEKRDKERLTKHLLAVFNLMRDGQYRTTAQIANEVNCLQTTAHARLRQLRAIGHGVPKRWVKGENGVSGYFEYALIVNRSLVDTREGQHEPRAA